MPRRDRFVPAGPRLDETLHPRLFQMIHEVAAATGQAAPADVYLLNEVNAWVAHRGGTMGLGSHRVMGVGLPLLQALSIAEFKAVIAHEFGHYWSGDVKLGPWIYKTRAAIGRTIAGVHETFIEAPFLWYGRLFLKLTHGVSRAAGIHCRRGCRSSRWRPRACLGPRRITALAPLFSAYMSRDVMPVLQAGCLPPIAAGFDEFLNADDVGDASKQIIETVESEGHTDLFDTHPSLRDRLAALGCGRDSSARVDGARLASTLIKDTDQQARALLAFAFGEEPIAALKAIDWNVVGESVIAVGWRDIAKSHSAWLSRFTADAVVGGQHQFIRLGSELVGSGEQNVNSGDRIERAVIVLATGIGVVLLDQGWRVETGPGRPVVFTRGRPRSIRLPPCARCQRD